MPESGTRQNRYQICITDGSRSNSSIFIWCDLNKKKVKRLINLLMTLHLRATGHHLPYRITQCYLPPDTTERAPPNPSHVGWYSIYLPQRDGRLSWPSWLDSAPAGRRTSDLSITSLTPNRCTIKTTKQVTNELEIGARFLELAYGASFWYWCDELDRCIRQTCTGNSLLLLSAVVLQWLWTLHWNERMKLPDRS